MMGNSNHLVGDNKFTLFPILGVERSFPWLRLGKVSAILGKLQLGKVSVILGKERILSFPRIVKRKASKGERKGFRPSRNFVFGPKTIS